MRPWPCPSGLALAARGLSGRSQFPYHYCYENCACPTNPNSKAMLGLGLEGRRPICPWQRAELPQIRCYHGHQGVIVTGSFLVPNFDIESKHPAAAHCPLPPSLARPCCVWPVPHPAFDAHSKCTAPGRRRRGRLGNIGRLPLPHGPISPYRAPASPGAAASDLRIWMPPALVARLAPAGFVTLRKVGLPFCRWRSLPTLP